MIVTHIIYSFHIGGAETMLIDIMNLQSYKHCVNLIIINDSYNKTLLKRINTSINVFFINRKEGSRNIFFILKFNIILLKLKSDVLHCHNHNILPLINPVFRRNIVLTLHSLGIPSKYLNKYNKLFAISEAVKNDIAYRTQCTPILIYNGIVTQKIAVRERNGINFTCKILCIGRLRHLVKGQHLLIEALHHYLKEYDMIDLQLDFIGEGPSERYLKELTSKFSLSKKINFIGSKDRDYIYEHLKDYDILVQPSLSEGFGLSVAEAMVAKLLVVVSDSKGLMEVIDDGKYGFYFQSGNSLDLANLIKYILLKYDINSFQKITNDARLYAINKFDIKSTVDNYNLNY